jgi:hypothetical protein
VAAQRRLAAQLTRLTASNVQSLVVTHSPVMVNAVESTALRLVRTEMATPEGRAVLRDGYHTYRVGREDSREIRVSKVVLPEGLPEVAKSLGCQPADVLLGEAFWVVEGPSDGAILGEWLRTLGYGSLVNRLRFMPANGESKAGAVAHLARLVYERARVGVLVDGGDATAAAEERVRRIAGRDVPFIRLSRPAIESYFSASAVERWLASLGIEPDQLPALGIGGKLAEPDVKDALRRLSHEVFGPERKYQVTEDGRRIARLMTESEIPPEIHGVAIELTLDLSGAN